MLLLFPVILLLSKKYQSASRVNRNAYDQMTWVKIERTAESADCRAVRIVWIETSHHDDEVGLRVFGHVEPKDDAD